MWCSTSINCLAICSSIGSCSYENAALDLYAISLCETSCLLRTVHSNGISPSVDRWKIGIKRRDYCTRIGKWNSNQSDFWSSPDRQTNSKCIWKSLEEYISAVSQAYLQDYVHLMMGMAIKRQFFKSPKSHPGQKMNMPLNQLISFLIQTALVLDFVHGYQLAGHVIWHGHFFDFVVPQQSPS